MIEKVVWVAIMSIAAFMAIKWFVSDLMEAKRNGFFTKKEEESND